MLSGLIKASWRHIRADAISEDEDAPKFFLASPEDIILAKLELYRSGGQTSERQRNDILGVLKVQKDKIDTVYLRFWAAELGLSDLLEKAMLGSF